jgi:hypothetical protein
MSFPVPPRLTEEMRADANSDAGAIAASEGGPREWVGFALIALRQCGMSHEEIRAILGAGDDAIVRRIWSCVGSRWIGGLGGS